MWVIRHWLHWLLNVTLLVNLMYFNTLYLIWLHCFVRFWRYFGPSRIFSPSFFRSLVCCVWTLSFTAFNNNYFFLAFKSLHCIFKSLVSGPNECEKSTKKQSFEAKWVMKPNRSMINKNKSKHHFDASKTCPNVMF